MWLYDNSHKKIEFLPYYKDRNIVSVLSTGDKTLNFSYPIEKAKNIVEEAYIRTQTDEYVIKQTKTNGNYLEVIANLNVEDLEGKTFVDFKTTYATITDTLNQILQDTGWRVGFCNVTKKRTITGQYKNAWNLSQSCIDTYMCELEYDTINKLINVYEKRGSYKGVFMIDGVNMKDLEIQSSSYEFYTRLIPIGKDGLTIESVNNGKPYLENHTYSNKIKTTYWKDDRYTIASELREDGILKLEELSQPVKSYSMTIKDLAKMNKKYKAYEISLGDTILLVSKEKNVRLKHRIVKYTEYPEAQENNKVEVSTTKITLETIQKKFNDTTATVDNMTNADGTVSTGSVAGLNEIAKDIEKKVDKVVGKGLSTNDYTDEDKSKLDSIKSEESIVIADEVLTESVDHLIYDKDINNKSFNCRNIKIVLELPPNTETENINLNIINNNEYNEEEMENVVITTTEVLSTEDNTFLLYDLENDNILMTQSFKGSSSSDVKSLGVGYKLEDIELSSIQLRTDTATQLLPVNTVIKIVGIKK